MELFEYQYGHNKVYGEFCDLLKRTPREVKSVKDIPFLPVELFKNNEVVTGNWAPEYTYTSSTTTGGTPSKHHVRSLQWYKQVYTEGFERVYGPLKDWTVLALLPSYLEREGSSLVHMAQGMIKASEHKESGFYLYDYNRLFDTISDLQVQGKPTLLLGVTFALLDFAEKISGGTFGPSQINWSELRIMETGGMKGRRREMIRAEVHDIIKTAFPKSAVDSEYGMTELLSQAYLRDSGYFECPPWMRVYTRDIGDPLSTPLRDGSRGALQIIDLANIHSCAFLSISDQGRVFEEGHFEVYGRLDHSEIRGCNLMVSL
ncbi:MAG: hypothetical protein RL754_798 [Bacteroidota bacterium]